MRGRIILLGTCIVDSKVYDGLVQAGDDVADVSAAVQQSLSK